MLMLTVKSRPSLTLKLTLSVGRIKTLCWKKSPFSLAVSSTLHLILEKQTPSSLPEVRLFGCLPLVLKVYKLPGNRALRWAES